MCISRYWVVLSFFLLLELLLDHLPLIHQKRWLSFPYHLLKLSFIIWCLAPITHNGSDLTYETVIAPAIEEVVDLYTSAKLFLTKYGQELMWRWIINMGNLTEILAKHSIYIYRQFKFLQKESIHLALNIAQNCNRFPIALAENVCFYGMETCNMIQYGLDPVYQLFLYLDHKTFEFAKEIYILLKVSFDFIWQILCYILSYSKESISYLLTPFQSSLDSCAEALLNLASSAAVHIFHLAEFTCSALAPHNMLLQLSSRYSSSSSSSSREQRLISEMAKAFIWGQPEPTQPRLISTMVKQLLYGQPEQLAEQSSWFSLY